MNEAQAAGGVDRLPWLSDEPARKAAPPPRRGRRDITGWAAAAVLLVAGTSFWLGTRSQDSSEPQGRAPVQTVAVPEPRADDLNLSVAPQPQVNPTPSREVRAERVPEVLSAPQPVVRLPRREPLRRVTVVRENTEAAAIEAAKPVVAQPAPRAATPLRAWPARVTSGASGRLVQIGAYGSRLQAKQGWVKMVRAYPAVQRLQAVVVETRNSRGRHFYRFQIGTTSQAHSEVLCQRMQRIDLSCAVVGLPWKAKVER